MTHKTKATPKDRQCGNTKPVQINRYPAGGPVKIVRPQIEGERCRQMSTVARVQKCTLAYSCSLGFRRWRRFISPSIAVLINCPVLSPGALTCSIPLMMSCVILAVTDCDLAFFDPVAMSTPLGCWCKTIYRKKRLLKALTCKTPCFYLVSYTLFYSKVKTKPGSVGALTGLLTTNQPESIEVAMRNNNTQREKILPFTVCNAYVQCTAWRTSIAVFVHISAISRMRHAAYNGAVFFDGVGMASTDAITNDTPRRPLMVGCYVYLSGYAYPGWYGILLIISQCITSDRPSMVLLVGERSRSLANLLAGLPIPASDATSTTVKKCLRTYNGLGYVYPAPAKSGVGISLPEITRAHNTRLACFFVPHSHILTMVGCMGAEQSAPGSLVTGKANPVQSATSKISLFSGGNIKPTREDAAMLATTPAQNPLFVWRFYSGQNSTYLTTTATSEREARLQLPAVRLVFVARIRQEGQRHA